MSESENGNNVVPPEAPRENMISTAVRFLQNPKVQQSPLEQRRSFLEKKGLTKEEIDLAIDRSGSATAVVQASPQQGAQLPAVPPQPQVIVAPVSTLSRVKDYVAYFIIASGATYGIYQLVKKYLLPFLYGPSPKDEQLAKVERSVVELQTSLNETMSKLQETLSSLQELVTTQSDKVKVISEQITAQRGPYAMAHIQDSQFTNEIKDEIKSLKGLLLSRKQFPPTPATMPVLPAWQMSQSPSDDSKKVNKEPASTKSDEPAQNGAEGDKPVTSAVDPSSSETQSPASKPQTKVNLEESDRTVKIPNDEEEVKPAPGLESVSVKTDVIESITDEEISVQQSPPSIVNGLAS